MMKVAVFLNSSAGGGYSGEEPEKIKISFREKDVETEFYEIGDDSIKDAVQSSENSGIDIIAAAGGDGTISSVVNKIAGKEIPFGVIPLGTLNHFAKDSGIPLTIEEAVNVIIAKKIRSTDIAEVNGHYFINNSSVGFYPKMVKHRDKEMENLGYNKWYAMFRALITIFKKYPVLNLNVSTEDHASKIAAPFIFIGNNIYAMDLFNLGKRDKLDEGVLSLYYPKTRGRFPVARFAFMSLINNLHNDEDFYNTTCNEIRIESRKEMLEVSADGEVLHLKPPLEYKIHTGKLKLIVP